MAMEKDIENLYSKVNEHSAKLTKIETEMPFFKDILERATKADEELGKTLRGIQDSIFSLNAKMEAQAKAISSTDEKLKQVESKVEAIEEKGKFDIWGFVLKNWLWIGTMIGVGIYRLAEYVKF